MWVVLVIMGGLLLCRRAWRMAAIADGTGIEVRNIGRTYRVPWDVVDAITVEKKDNVSSAVSCVAIRTKDGRRIVARAASSYSKRKVDDWCAQLDSAAPMA